MTRDISRLKSIRKKIIDNPNHKKCLICGEPYVPKNKDQKFCPKCIKK